MNDLTDQQIDDLVRRAQPHTSAGGHGVDHLGLHRAEQDLLEEIMSTPARPQASYENDLTTRPDHSVELGDVRALPVRPPRRRLRAVAGIAAAAAVLAAVAVPALIFTGKDDSKVEIRNPAAAVNQAPGEVPRVLLDDPAWKLDYVENLHPYDGEEHFLSGDDELDVHWRPADQYTSYYDDRLDVSTPMPITALGQTGALFTYSASDHAVILPVKPGARTFFEIRGSALDRRAFAALIAKLSIVPDGEWEAALPASAVKPSDETRVAREMLTGIPLPPGFDAGDLPTGQANDYYQYGAVVTGAVTCGWLKEYRTARASGDEATMKKVDDAMSTSRNWAVLKTMAKDGAWPDVIWEYADKVADRKPISAEEIAQGLSCSE